MVSHRQLAHCLPILEAAPRQLTWQRWRQRLPCYFELLRPSHLEVVRREEEVLKQAERRGYKPGMVVQERFQAGLQVRLVEELMIGLGSELGAEGRLHLLFRHVEER